MNGLRILDFESTTIIVNHEKNALLILTVTVIVYVFSITLLGSIPSPNRSTAWGSKSRGKVMLSFLVRQHTSRTVRFDIR